MAEPVIVVVHPADAAAARRAWSELYPHEQDRCVIRVSALAGERGRALVLDPAALRGGSVDRVAAWMREATEVYSRNPNLGREGGS